MKATGKHPLITGALILTVTGVLSRVIGFFYRIYLSRMFGEEGMGLYQLLSPVLSISFSLTAAGYQTAISKLVAEQAAGSKRPTLRPMLAGFSISMPLSVLCNAVVYLSADRIAADLLREPRTADMLRILSFSIPLSAVHACVNGHFYGVKKAGVPAASQLIEQFTRVGCVWLLSARCFASGTSPSIEIAVLGLTVGELFSMLFSFAAIGSCRSGGAAQPRKTAEENLYGGLLVMALPLTANRIVLNLLQSVESISIPTKLQLYGYDNVTALSVYGVLTGMAMPFIFFPNALTSSVAVLLLPIISENFALNNLEAVRKATVKTVCYCGIMGFFCMAGFVFLGDWIGTVIFHSPLAGYFITTLGFICPFLYLDTTLSSILQGLGKVGYIFAMNVFCLLIRLAFVLFLIPVYGIKGYLWGLLVSQLTQCLLYLLCLRRFLRQKPVPF